jgi:hypothetical protein
VFPPAFTCDSQDYDDLLVLEAAAAETGVGLHSKDPSVSVASIRDIKVLPAAAAADRRFQRAIVVTACL